MKIREFSFKHKKQVNTLNYVEFDSAEELLEKVGPQDLLRIYNFGAKELAKKLFLGVDPFKRRKKTVKLKLDTLSEDQISFLRENGLLD